VTPNHKTQRSPARQRGFSMIELLVAVTILLLVSGFVLTGLADMSMINGTITNRTQMHSGVRSATELLQQEIGQAGKVALPAAVTLTGPVIIAGTAAVGVSSSAGMFVSEKLIIDTGPNEETVTLTAVSLSPSQITAAFTLAHASGAVVRAAGAFASGVVPTTAANGSTATRLKLYGDVNDDGNMVYIEYTCDTDGGNLYRNTMSVTAASKPARTPSMILLPNIRPNPDGTPCFTYQEKAVGTDTYVVNVAVTLTVQTELQDPNTNQFQLETKALLNVSPRNVFEVWQMASIGTSNRIQPMPASVSNLLPNVTEAQAY